MSELVFGGFVTSGVGHHVELLVPGRRALLDAPADWPEMLHPGSLNVRVNAYPVDLQEHGLANRIAELDKALFVPAFEIRWNQFGNNLLTPRPREPRRGDAQVWRARLVVEDSELTVACWALRRFGSGVGEQLEFVADHRLRDHGIVDGVRVQAVLLGTWPDSRS